MKDGEKTRRNRKKQRKKHRNIQDKNRIFLCKEMGINWRKWEETGRNVKQREETGRNGKKQEKMLFPVPSSHIQPITAHQCLI